MQSAKSIKTTSETVGHRSLGSSVGAVLKHDNDEEEEEYDPRRPAIGNVASVIKVSERRWDLRQFHMLLLQLLSVSVYLRSDRKFEIEKRDMSFLSHTSMKFCLLLLLLPTLADWVSPKTLWVSEYCRR